MICHFEDNKLGKRNTEKEKERDREKEKER